MDIVSKPHMLGLGWTALAAVALGPSSIGADPAGAAPAPTSFSIGGNASEPLSPGDTVHLDLELTNPHGRPLAVTHLRISVMRVKGPNASAARPCSSRDYTVGQAPSSLRLTVAPNTTISLSGLGVEPASWPHVGMLNLPVNQDGCQRATVTLRYSAVGALGP
jgi:hypothetical protein